MKCREEYQQTVMTIFYEVDPSDARKQTGDSGKAFHETCVGKEEKMKAWRQALSDVAGIAGYHSSNCDNEADLISKVASDVTAVLGFTPSKDLDIKSKFILQSEQVKMIVLVGPAGIGKTTTARVLYNQLSPGFPFSTVLENIRGNYEKPCGNDYQLKLRLEKKLLSQLFNQKDIEVHHLGEAQQMLSGKKVLVVLDEVDSLWQLEEMAKQLGWFGHGSIIIITTEDRKLVKQLRLGIDHIYEMKFPTSTEPMQIFCQYAFGQKSPDYGFEMLAWEVTGLAGDFHLPLGLKVMGSYLRGMSRNEWIDALPRLKSSLDREIESTLRFSYEGLSDNDKALFLHIACFFGYFKVDSVKRCLEKSGLDVNHGLQVLADKSLIFIDRGWVKMHSLLQQMGREIVKNQSLEEPGKRQFLWNIPEIIELLEENTPLQCLKLLDLSLSRYLKRIPDLSKATSLEKLDLHGCESLLELTSSIDSATKLTICNLSNCRLLKELPSSISRLINLEELNLSDCSSLKEFSGCSSLEKLSGCLSLKELNLSFTVIMEVPSSMRTWPCFYQLDMAGCSSLKEFPNVPDSIVALVLCGTLIEEVPPWIENLFRLRKLIMYGSKRLKRVFSN
uniref:TIR domain-containing protein n=1 Tax=Brassica campestris TaxID=3711 RepID=M4E4K7_BRACM